MSKVAARQGAVEITSRSGAPGSEALDERVRLILAVERHWWRYGVDKETAVRKTLGMSLLDYQRTLNQLTEDEAILAAEPVLIRRLRRQRAARTEARFPRRARAGDGR